MDHMDGIKDLFTEFDVLNFWDTNNNKSISSDDFNKYRKEDWDFYQRIRNSDSEPTVLYLTDNSKGEFYRCENGDGLFILAPGMIFTYCSKMFYGVNFLTDKPVYDFIVILIIGLIISRIGSVIVEPLLKKSKNS